MVTKVENLKKAEEAGIAAVVINHCLRSRYSLSPLSLKMSSTSTMNVMLKW
jgi:hypothetical protein